MPNQTPPVPSADRFTDPTLPPEIPGGGDPAGFTPGAPAAGATAVPAPDRGKRRTLMIILAVLVALLVTAVAVTTLLTRGEPEPKYLKLGDDRLELAAEGLSFHAIDTPDALLVNSLWQQAMVDAARGAAPGDPMPEEFTGVEVPGLGEFDCSMLDQDSVAPNSAMASWECRGPIPEGAMTDGYGMQVLLTPQVQNGFHGEVVPSDPQWAEHAIKRWG